MINTIKWAIYYRTHKDKERSKKIFDLIWNKLECDTWDDVWNEEQEESFYEQIDLLLPINTVEEQAEIYSLVKEVFGEVEVKNGHTRQGAE
tara:strand:- start:207 stop:479 length:273 start_codon:yes stop_codon:yes gene_type:complete